MALLSRQGIDSGLKGRREGEAPSRRPFPFTRLRLEYDGTHFDGWQVQPGRRTVQGLLEGALRAVYGVRVSTVAAGRTDAGVHARDQVVSFSAPGKFQGDLAAALNTHLPEDMVVLSAEGTQGAFHAQKHAVSKTYCYTILNRPVRPALGRSQVYWIARPLSEKLMKKEVLKWVGRRDFSAFAGKSSRGLAPVCRVSAIDVSRAGDIISIDITADRFLHHMVRRLAGHLVQAGWGEKAFKPLTLPPRGLALIRVLLAEKKRAPGGFKRR